MNPQTPAFSAWLDDFFAAYYRRRPVNATFIGVHEHDGRLPDHSEQGAGDTLVEMQTLLKGLKTLPPEPLNEAQALDRKLAEGYLRIQIWEFQSEHFYRGNPSLYAGEAVFSVMSLFLNHSAPLSERVASAIARMQAIPHLLAQGKANVRWAPLAWTERALRECKGALVFFQGGIDCLIQDEQIADPHFRTAADGAVVAFTDFQRYLETELRTNSTESVACGEEAFDLLMRQGHFLDMDPSEIVRYAQAQLSDAKAYLGEHAADFGAPTWREALAQLADAHPSVEEYYDQYTEVWQACRATAKEHDLVSWLDFPIRYVPRPVWSREAAPYLYFLFYRSPPAFNRLPVHNYLVTPIQPSMPSEKQEHLLRANNDSVIKLNHVVHHGSIGHHVQNWHAFRAPSRIGQVAAVDCAARIAMFCGGTMAEGWACYATSLMEDAGFLTPLESYSQYHSRSRMCARAIADVQLHTGRLSFEEVVALYEQEAGMGRDAAHREAVKNSMFPGAAMMYLIGTDLIHQLRQDLSVQRGPEFTLRAFHDRFLSYGSIPVSLICTEMQNEPGYLAKLT